jgi:catechol 2,3-dioxygenase-like lactoylglutathione lyase family enzyme
LEKWGVKVTGADHTSYTISNLERSLAFYVGTLGCEILWQREITDEYFRKIVGFPGSVVKAAHLLIPGSGHHLELFEYVQPAGSQADLRTNNVGSSHISFLVDDLHAAYDELRAKGIQFRSPPVEITSGAHQGSWGLYLLDPDGITVELFQPSNRNQ